MKFSTNVRKVVLLRAEGRCEGCGLKGSLQLHHRRPRGMGGSTDPKAGTAANALALCSGCHLQVAEQKRDGAREMGWLIPQGTDPEETPVRLYDGWFWLGVGGEAHPIKKPLT